MNSKRKTKKAKSLKGAEAIADFAQAINEVDLKSPDAKLNHRSIKGKNGKRIYMKIEKKKFNIIERLKHLLRINDSN